MCISSVVKSRENTIFTYCNMRVKLPPLANTLCCINSCWINCIRAVPVFHLCLDIYFSHCLYLTWRLCQSPLCCTSPLFDFEFPTDPPQLPSGRGPLCPGGGEGGGVDRYAVDTPYSARIEICTLHRLLTGSMPNHVHTIGFPLRF